MRKPVHPGSYRIWRGGSGRGFAIFKKVILKVGVRFLRKSYPKQNDSLKEFKVVQSGLVKHESESLRLMVDIRE